MGRFNGRVFCVTGLGGLYLEGLIHGGAYFRNFTVYKNSYRVEKVRLSYYSNDHTNIFQVRSPGLNRRKTEESNLQDI